jgi:hypothetical protein
MASTTIFDESEAEWVKDTCYATLARMSLPELLYHALVRECPDALNSLEKPENHY